MMVSYYHYRKREGLKSPQHHRHKNYTGKMSFQEFVSTKHPGISKQFTYIVDEKGEDVVDYVGRFENLEDDFFSVVKRLGLPGEIKLPHLLKSKHGKYREYYNPETRTLVFNKFREDVERFNYEF